MQEILFLRGLPASGKTSFALQYIKDNPNYKRINKDDVRKSINDREGRDEDFWSSSFEKTVLKEQRQQGINFLKEGYSLIVDDTNFAHKHYAYWFEISKIYNIKFTLKEFNASVEECIEIDKTREKPVGEKVIRIIDSQRKQNMIKTDTRFILNQDYDLEECVICDIDGTLALLDGRNPYFPNIYDKLNYPVAYLISDSHKDAKMFLFTGRKEEFRNVTEKWLSKYNIRYDKLIMRKDNDNRADEIVKKEMYEKYIKDKYYVNCIYDDRDKVVKMWRDLGLLCLQVYYGNF